MQSVSYMGDCSTTEFNFNFPYYENSNIIVTVNNIAATGYTIVNNNPDSDVPYIGGKVVFNVAPTVFDSIKISRSLPLTRVVDYQPTAKIETDSLNQDMNYIMEVIKDIKDEFDDLSTKYAEIAGKESTAALLARIDEINDEIGDVNQTITDFNDEIEQGRIMSKDDFYSYTTNCITDIPQNIKLELNNGTLTLKKGSVLTRPDGTQVTTTVDKTYTQTGSASYQGLLFVERTSGSIQRVVDFSKISSGSTLPENPNALDVFYNTTDLKIYLYNNSQWFEWVVALPTAICTVTSGAITSIDQVFNGFGYIGSTIFALPGVKGLAPNGLNEKGLLNNILWETTSVITYTQTSGSDTLDIVVKTTNNVFDLGDYTYNSDTNYNYYEGNVSNNSIILGNMTFTNGVITSITFKKVFSLKTN